MINNSNVRLIVIIISYNNPIVLASTLDKLKFLDLPTRNIHIYENGSPYESKIKITELASTGSYTLVDSSVNRGWGGAINNYLDLQEGRFDENDIFLIMAHDCYFLSFDLSEVLRYYQDPRALFVCPAYPNPVVSKYNIFKSFYSRPGFSSGLIRIGHQTAFFARAVLFDRVRYDEEFWLYGGEYEIFERAHSQGLRTYQALKTIVVNPGSDSTSETSFLAYKLNSIYYAYVRHGLFGLAIRSLVVSWNVINLFLSGDKLLGGLLLRTLLFACSNPGKGHRSFRESSLFRAKFQIPPLF